MSMKEFASDEMTRGMIYHIINSQIPKTPKEKKELYAAKILERMNTYNKFKDFLTEVASKEEDTVAKIAKEQGVSVPFVIDSVVYFTILLELVILEDQVNVKKGE